MVLGLRTACILRTPAMGFVYIETPSMNRIDWVLKDIVQPSGYVQWEYFSRQRLLAREIASASDGTSLRVLDIGCGHGALTLTLAESASFEVVAVDVLASRLSSVRAKMRNRDPNAAVHVRILLADGEALPFRDHAFDVVVATEVLEHLDEPERMLREARRVVRPGGRFFVTTPNAEAMPYRILRFLPNAVVSKLASALTQPELHPQLCHHDSSPRGHGHPDYHRREGFTLRELKLLTLHAGLLIRVAYTYRIPLPDKVMKLIPRRLSRLTASFGARPFPLGLQLYAQFTTAQ